MIDEHALGWEMGQRAARQHLRCDVDPGAPAGAPSPSPRPDTPFQKGYFEGWYDVIRSDAESFAG